MSDSNRIVFTGLEVITECKIAIRCDIYAQNIPFDCASCISSGLARPRCFIAIATLEMSRVIRFGSWYNVPVWEVVGRICFSCWIMVEDLHSIYHNTSHCKIFWNSYVWYQKLEILYGFEIWQAPRQQSCRDACEFSQRSQKSWHISPAFKTSRDVTITHLVV